MRRVYCSGRMSDCAHLERPSNVERCEVKPCVAEWQAGDWSKVSFGLVLYLFGCLWHDLLVTLSQAYRTFCETDLKNLKFFIVYFKLFSL